jgi:CRISPR-associated exonuclease Cas4
VRPDATPFSPPAASPARDPLPLSALNDFLYCERRAALKFIEGLRGDNEHTLLGDLAHEHVDIPGYEQRAGWELLRALPLFSDRLRLTGKADLVEIRRADAPHSEIADLKSQMPRRIAAARPVEYKKGPARRFDNDEVQLCAQALCLEEMLAVSVPVGAIFHAQSQRRTEIAFDGALRARTLDAIAGLRTLISGSKIPPAELKPQCDGCSLREICVPEAAAAVRTTALFEPRKYP